ncbi:hypothetical protein BDN72DRAFT_860594 [Pluteus cervinus]|uniref:Uncharacterized protein n=1 Tax=Pluteus cervinus TaxID=181527 RepID=A0ACD3AIE2_9AGAR|nr:hypothetical protein BDN72DRAFT_860594 [Pluteus cervinus]
MSIDGLPNTGGITETPRYGHLQDPTAFSTTDTVRDFANLTDSYFHSATVPSSPLSYTPTVIAVNPKDNTAKERRPKKEATIEPYQTHSFIPPTGEGRTLILCFDGTGDKFDKDNSNVVQFFSLLKKDRKDEQRVYYQSGIGTYISPSATNPVTRKLSSVLDLMFAWDLDRHVTDGYQFLMQNYTQGDKICIFGFSRGAYTARSLAGMIHKVGLLPAGNVQQVAFAYKLYRRTDQTGWEQSNAFKRACSIDVSIEFVGVWDTVDSVGLIPKRLPFTTSNTIIKTFRHAISFDERRAKFKPNLWNKRTLQPWEKGWSNKELPIPVQPTIKATSGKSQTLEPNSTSSASTPPSPSQWSDRKVSPQDDKGDSTSGNSSIGPETTKDMEWTALGKAYLEARAHQETDVLEVWFAGCHCDIGGGSVPNDTRHSLARIPLRWMVRECFKAKTGIKFDVDGLRRLGMDPNTLWPIVTERPKRLDPTSDLDLPKPMKEPKTMKRSIKALAEKRLPELKQVPSVGIVFGFDEKETDLTLEEKYKEIKEKLDDSGREYIEVGTEEEEELNDALSPVYDQLELAKGWWVLEYIPLTSKYQDAKHDKWVTKTK